MCCRCARFIRLWDRPDRDPATARRVLQTFRDELHTLFVRGYILCDPNDDGSAAQDSEARSSAPCVVAGPPDHEAAELADPAPKTITQIAMEACLNAPEVVVGGETRRLWGQASKRESLEVMASVKSVVRDVVARLDADFTENALYLCMDAFDLDSWEEVLQIVQAKDHSRAAEDKVRTLRTRARRFCDTFSIEWSITSFVAAVRLALTAKGDLPADVPEHLRNRVAWANAFASAQGAEVDHRSTALLGLEPMLRFYWSFRDGTGDVERHLGRFFAMQQSHQGAAEGDISFAEVCLEVHAEGPLSEEEIAKQPDRRGGTLLLTPFSRQCAQLWLALFGRRFACQRVRFDKGQARPEKSKGSLKAVKRRHRIATKRLLEMAAKDAGDGGSSKRRTILGFRRRSVEADTTPAPAPGKSLKAFRATTERRAKEKNSFRVWSGFGAAPPKLRRANNFAASASGQARRAGNLLKQASRNLRASQSGGAASSSSRSKPHQVLTFKMRALPPRPKTPAHRACLTKTSPKTSHS